MKRWSDEAWEAALPVYRKILGHPFVRELADRYGLDGAARILEIVLRE